MLSCEEAEIRTDIPLNILMCMNYETQSIWNRISENQNKNEDLLETLLFHAQKEGWTYLAEKYNRQDHSKDCWNLNIAEIKQQTVAEHMSGLAAG